MVYIKRLFVILLSLFIAVALCGCSFDYVSLICSGEVAKSEAIPKIAFSREVLSEQSEELIMTADELLEVESEYSRYRGDIHFSALAENERTVYRAYEYALENGYTYIYVDDLLVSDGDRLGEILNFLALDSPLLEQNLFYAYGDFNLYYDLKVAFFDTYALLDGFYIDVRNFESDIWEKKLQAIEKAKDIISAMPQNMNETEKAEYLHRYILDKVSYYDYTDLAEHTVRDYLYDGFITGRTQCDGTANMYSLLLNMVGVECVEKQYSGEGDEIGHTWNMVKLSDKWYNIDATANEDNKKENLDIKRRRYFAFNDTMQEFEPDYSGIYPSADENYGMRIIAHITEISTLSLANTVYKEFTLNNNNTALIIVDSYSEKSADRAVQKLADWLRDTVYWVTYDLKDNRTAMIVYI